MTLSSPPGTGRALPSLSDGDYVRFGRLVHARFGLNFPEKRRGELERGVQQAFAASTCADLDAYHYLLQDGNAGGVEMEQLINALTVGETHFFRDAAQFGALFDHVLPQLIERRRPLRTLRIWSAGCASGAEPYSIAMMLRELLPDVDEWTITILGTDISTEALGRAHEAEYGEWAFREDRAKEWRRRYFRQRGKRYELVPQVRRMVTFARLNLAEDGYPAYETNTTLMDLILCRNVTIYFSEPVTRQVVGRLYDALVDGGWLVVGHSEPSLVIYHRFQARNYPGTVLYQRTGQSTALPADWDWLQGEARPATQDPCGVDLGVPASASPSTPANTRSLSAPANIRSLSAAGSDPCVTPPESEDPVERGRELLAYGHSEEARDVLLRVVHQGLDGASARALLGQAYANLGCWAEAERWCHQAVSLDRLALDAYHTLSLVLQHQGRLQPAIEAMRKVVYIDRNHALGHFGLASLYHGSAQLSRALKSLDNARRLLDARAEEELIPDSGGITVGRLRETVVRQQQQWAAEASDLKA